MRARTTLIATLTGAVAVALAFTPGVAGARPMGDAPSLVPLGSFPVGSTINAPYDCSDLAEIAAGAWGREDDEGPIGDTDLPVDGSVYSFTPTVGPGEYVAIVLCGEEAVDEQIVERFTEGIFDVGATTDEYLYSFILYDECDEIPDTVPDTTTPGTTTPGTTVPDTTIPDTTIAAPTTFPPGPARAPHVAPDCPEIGSGGGSLPATGSSGEGALALVATLAVLAGGAMLLVRRRVA
ncbi:MAG: LPXTG cell wall anchor domain-containing protein [Actinomycetota bacterium]|nr:LPXTG cell wall anchor domain-containing protein [Actinomycetota bacterium]